MVRDKVPQRQSDWEVQTLLHEQAVLCSALLRLLCRTLAALEGHQLSFADRSRLSRALTRLQEVEIVSASPIPPCSPK